MRRQLPLVLAPALVALLLAPSGCALTDVTVHPPADGHVVAPSNVGRGREVIIAVPFAYARPIHDRCGMKKNGYNVDTADVHCSVPPGEWVAMALADGLDSSGFHVIVNQAGSSPSTPRVDGNVTQFFVEPKLNAFTFVPETDIEVSLRVTSPSGLVADRTFYFKSEEEALIGTDDKFESSVSAATRQATAGMVSAIVNLLDRYPSVGVIPNAGAASSAMAHEKGGAR